MLDIQNRGHREAAFKGRRFALAEALVGSDCGRQHHVRGAQEKLRSSQSLFGEMPISDLRSARSFRATACDDAIFASALDSCLGSMECLKKVPLT
jgi:hypothetical protein